MHKHGWEKSRYLVDGFPRNQDNVNGWNKVIGQEAEVKGIIYIECPEDIMEARILHRGKTSGRLDDNKETIKKRFVQYTSETFPIIEKLGKEGMPVIKLLGNETPDKVYAKALELMHLTAPAQETPAH